MKDILQKIIDIRNIKGFSQEYVANELNISTATYQKVEKGDTKLSVERLSQIAEILQTPVDRFFGTKPPTAFYQNNNHDIGTITAIQDVENYYQENRETTQKLIQTMEHEITHLQEEIAFLREMVKK